MHRERDSKQMEGRFVVGIVRGFEKGLERLVSRAFRGNSNGTIKPVEIANLIRNTMDDESFSISEGRTVAPHSFTVRLGTDAFAQAREWGTALAQELADVALEHAQRQDYSLRDAVTVTFRKDESLRPTKIEVDASLGGTKAPTTPRPRPAARPHLTSAEQQASTQHIRPNTNRTPVIELDGNRYALSADTVVMGRAGDAGLHINDQGASRRHAEIIRRGDRMFVRDLGSTNGTYVNGTRIQGEEELLDGTIIAIGHARLTFSWQNAPEGMS